MDLSFDPETLTNGNDRELWNKQCDQVKLMFNTCLKTPPAKMIRNDDSVKDRPHLIWRNLLLTMKILLWRGQTLASLLFAFLSSVQVSSPRAWIF